MRLKANKTGNGELKLMKNYHPRRALVNSFFSGRSRALSGFNLNSKLELLSLYNYCFRPATGVLIFPFIIEIVQVIFGNSDRFHSF